jgi:O-acetyl-ADP-ribose deacetylase (regulator of RNase III)
MIHYITGNLFETKAQALVNTVNTVGVMGKGIALQFKNEFPNNFKIYAKACKDNEFQIGNLLIVEDKSLLLGNRTIINFPTKTNWRKPSEYDYIEQGLIELKKAIVEKKIKSVAIPPLGAGNGGLQWSKVKQLIEKHLSEVEVEIMIYEPNSEIKEIIKKERVQLTPARAMLLAVLYDLVGEGEFVSEFSSEKICYFLQRFGANDIFKLDFNPNFYGPYSGKVKHVLYYLNGSYIAGYNSKDKKPFEELNLIMDAKDEVMEYLQKHENYNLIVQKVKKFLTGYYTDFSLELLSSVDFIIQKNKDFDLQTIKTSFSEWSMRKKSLFSDDSFLVKAIYQLRNAGLIQQEMEQ